MLFFSNIEELKINQRKCININIFLESELFYNKKNSKKLSHFLIFGSNLKINLKKKLSLNFSYIISC